jgi:GNAT superfamily N-acetyltransferase
MEYTTCTLAERPDLRSQLKDVEEQAWLPFMVQSPVSARCWGKVLSAFPEHQTLFVSPEDKLIAGGVVVPIAWDGRLQTLPDGWDEVLEQGVTDHEAGRRPNAMSALEAVVAPEYQSRGLSTEIIKSMRRIAAEHGYHSLIAPVRPTLKSLYPLMSIETYAHWKRPDGLPVDPWLRVHARLGAEIIALSPRSMTIPGSVEDWAQWTGLSFPESGRYVVQGALQPIEIDLESGQGVYYDPNVWMQHRLDN